MGDILAAEARARERERVVRRRRGDLSIMVALGGCDGGCSG